MDTVSIVVYGGVNGVWLNPNHPEQKRKKFLNPLPSWKPAAQHREKAASAQLTGWLKVSLSRAARTG